MKPVTTTPALADQVYQAILDDICRGDLLPGTHLKQEELAQSLGVSRQPVQQAMALLKADGLVEDVGRRGLRVSELDIESMHHHYEVRALLDGLAARNTALRTGQDSKLRAGFETRAHAILAAGAKAVDSGDVPEMIRQDELFHRLFYELSDNPLLVVSAEPHWRYLRRVMGDLLRSAEAPSHRIWEQHEIIVSAVLDGKAATSELLMVDHATLAAQLLAGSVGPGEVG